MIDDLEEMRRFALDLDPNIGPAFGQDVVGLIDRYRELSGCLTNPDDDKRHVTVRAFRDQREGYEARAVADEESYQREAARADALEEALRALDRAIGSMPDAGFAIDMPARSDYAGERVPNPRWKWWDELARVRRSVHGVLDAQNTAFGPQIAKGENE